MADAERALAENRLHSPAGDNAVEAYLALRERSGRPDVAIETALADLSPYVVNGIEQATADGELDEAGRRLALLQRMDAEAPALPRLRAALDQATLAAREAAAAEAQQAARMAAVPVAAPRDPAPPAAAATAPAPRSPSSPPAVSPVAPAPAPASIAAQGSRPEAGPAAPAPTVGAPPRRLLSQPSPRFPAQALRRRLEGSVDLRLQVGPDGRVVDAAVLESSHAVFEREAVLAARRWRYEPADRTTEVRVAVAFRLPGSS